MTPQQAIITLRRNHAEALSVADDLESAGADEVAVLRELLSPFIEEFLWEHCTMEELVVFPELGESSADRELAEARREAHAQLRRAAVVLGHQGDAKALRTCGRQLRDYVERGERELYRRFDRSARAV